MRKDDNFDLVLAIPCEPVKGKKSRSRNMLDISSLASLSLEKFSDSPLQAGGTELEIKNAAYDNRSNLLEYADIFCEQIEKHSRYELVFNDEASNIKTERTPLVFGQAILYEDEIANKFIPEACYNFFAILSKLAVKKASSFENDIFTIVYLVVPDINFQDLTLLMDQSHELWCNILGNVNSRIVFTKYMALLGYKYLGKIYRIVFSDSNQFETIAGSEGKESKLFNILATEVYKYKDDYSHQIELSENANDYSFSSQGNTANFSLAKKEKFFEGYNMYSSYMAYASIYSYYYIINEGDKDLFSKRITPDKANENFSSEANILFVLETELFKITACLVLSGKINEQINSPDMQEIQEMFRSFINTRPLFEKLNYRYLGAQKEADFIYKQFRIGDMLSDYDRKRELLKSYCEVNSSITSNRNSRILNCIGILFTFIAGWDRLTFISGILFDNKNTVKWSIEYIIPAIVSLIIIGIIVKIIEPVKYIKRLLKRGNGGDKKPSGENRNRW